MTPIKTLFDETKDIYRTIEKVVTFGNLSEDALAKEIGEYVVTDKLRDNFETLLEALDAGLRDSSHEIGVWVSGFYGSGKSSFSKYIGLALDHKRTIEGKPLRDRLANRINSPTIEPLLNSLVKKYDPVVFLIDLSAQQSSSYNLAPVGTIIYNEVMKWAGYPSEEKMALFERMLEMDGKLDTFKQTLRNEKDTDWDEVKHTNPLKAKAMAQNMAPVLYPQIWADARSFQIMQIDSIESEQERMTKMLALIRKRTGHDNVIFIVDEVGQYISAKEELILGLQGTLHNLKDIGQGKAWLLATAQQTLTEDNANARYNSDKLYKLNDRFPIKIDIEASDIKEIATKRLLGKSAAGTSSLKALYAQHGESLRIRTKLENSEKTIFKADLSEKDFIDLYPFLPNHFTLLLTLLGKLASHSDRGVQYCSWAYVQRLRQANATISMTESGDPNENAMAERVLRSLKDDCKLARGFSSFSSAEEAVERAINAYNTVRPHASLNYLTPHQMHQRKRKPKLRWYPYKKVRYGNVQYEGLFR